MRVKFQKTETNFCVKTEVFFDKERIQDEISGFYNYSFYWFGWIKSRKIAEGLTIEDFRKGGKMNNPPKSSLRNYDSWRNILPVTEGCSLTLSVIDPGKTKTMIDPTWIDFVLDREAIKKGIQIMAEKYPYQFENFINDTGDIYTTSVFMQSIVYGQEHFE